MKTLIFGAISIALVIIENSILNYFKVFGYSIDFLLIYVCFVSVFFEKRTALIIAVLSGLSRDMLVGGILGLDALIMFTIAYLFSEIEDKIFKDSRFTISMLVVFASVVSSAFKMIFYKEYINGNLYNTIFGNFVIFSIANSICAVISYRFFVKFNRILKRSTSLY